MSALISRKLRHRDGRLFDVIAILDGERMFIQRTVEVRNFKQWTMHIGGGRRMRLEAPEHFKEGTYVISDETRGTFLVLKKDTAARIVVVAECLILSNPEDAEEWQLLPQI